MAEVQENKTLTPAFVVYLNDTRFSAEQEADVKEIIIKDRIDMPSSFSITMSDSLRKWTDSDDFTEGSTVKIMLGYKDDVEEVINAEITGLSPIFKMNADDVVIINGQNHLHRLNRGKKTRTFSNMSHVDIIRQIADESGMQSDIDDLGSEIFFLIQRNQSDFEYLMNIARLHNCNVWAKDGTLFIKNIEDSEEDEVIIEWGKTLIDFHPRLNSAGLLNEVEVRGWDQNNVSSITGSATIDDISFKVGGNQLGGQLAQEYFGDSKMTLVDDNIEDSSVADKIALDLLTGNSMNYIIGKGKSQGNYKIKSGRIIELKELGTRFSGQYYVKSMEHRFVANEGFTTNFELISNTV